ncbi:hypothetical protein C8R42DRAFT_216416 [Lentinula raphanica]|nr:hypothetical protein C8R42DRAFT_216416 [Lentinula raphanica]
MYMRPFERPCPHLCFLTPNQNIQLPTPFPRAQSNTYTPTQDLLVKSRKKPAACPKLPSPTMYPFRQRSTWHSLVVNVLLLSTIASAMALPIEPDPTEPRIEQKIVARGGKAGSSNQDAAVATASKRLRSSGSNEAGASGQDASAQPTEQSPKKPKKPKVRSSGTSEAKATLREVIVGVIIKNGMTKVTTEEDKEIWVKKDKLEPDARCLMALIPSELALRWSQSASDKGLEQVTGYQTTKNPSSPSNFKWERTIDRVHGGSIYGARTTLYPADRIIKIATVEMSQNLKTSLTKDLIQKVTQSRSDKLPNVLSIYELLLHMMRSLKDEYGINVDFDMSPDSEFGEAFWEMLGENGTGEGRVLAETGEDWERELYRQIMVGDIRLDDALLDSGNKVILETLWDKVHLVNNQDDWDEERRKQLERGGQD